MGEDWVERDVLIEAPIHIVWEVISDPEHIVQWFSDKAQLDVRPGGEGILTTRQGSYHLRLETVDPPRRLSWRWFYPAGEKPRPANSTLVEFTLIEEGANTRLRVVESGIQLMPWPDAEKDEFAESHANGWSRHLERLRTYAPAAADVRRRPT